MRVQENRGVVSVCIQVRSPNVGCPVMIPFRLLLITEENDNGAGILYHVYIVIIIMSRTWADKCVYICINNDVLNSIFE